ncbi:MAG: YchJ family protein [Deltaproteobacteria bacterium]|nr:YchJ family protein [Deltaproteobacteria bacterium]MBW2535517.1 YchJ family protein [Deltaproteobacteria bacterium]
MELSCPCGNEQPLEECCGPIIQGERPAATAEQLMRSRYTAYTLGEVDYILGTHHPDTAEEADRKSTEQWSNQATWQGLEVRETAQGGPDDEQGVVEFVAHYEIKGREFAHHERAEFQKVRGKWRYVDGEMVKPKPVKVGPKIGRNDPCPCGSGKKYKKCCLP